jgi:glycosyltransferase involved in cell wall biosynthesis
VEAVAPSISAIVCAYTLDRWELFLASVQSLRSQTVHPLEIIVCIDHNDEMLKSALESDAIRGDRSIPLTVVANRYGGRLGSARTTAAELARGDILVFLDDDARAEPDLLERLRASYFVPSVVAVGGAPLPDYSRPRPVWFPHEFDWVFGCVYAGLPTELGPTPRLIGATMSVRREALRQIGYFHSDNHDDMDMCHRLARRWPNKQILFEPRAIARHYVHQDRLTWSYFWRRCFFVNRGKVAAHRNLPGTGDLEADRRFVTEALNRGLRREARHVLRGDFGGLLRIACLNAGILLAASGYLTGVLEYWWTKRMRPPCGQSSLTDSRRGSR